MQSTEIPPPPTLTDILMARNVVNRCLRPTPVSRPQALAEKLGFDVVLKCENMQPIGAFKVRGGVNYMANLSPEDRTRGVVSASTGNHAQSIAYAGRLFDVPVTIFMPEINNPAKVEATRRLGATVIEVGKDFDECWPEGDRYAEDNGMKLIHVANEPLLIAGFGTYALELIEDEPELDVVIVPVGGGSGVCGTGIVFKNMRPETKIIAVQAENMPAVHDSYHQKKLISYEGGMTWAEGLATRVTFEYLLQIMQDVVDDVVLVSEEGMRQAMILLMETTPVIAEGAGAAALAAACNMRADLAGKRVGLIVSGGNVTGETIRNAFTDDQPWI